MYREVKSGGAAAKCFRFSEPFSILPAKPGSQALAEDFLEKMNARPEIREAILIRRMKYWLAIARCPLVNIRVQPWRARKNFWALCKRHPDLAQTHGFGPTSVF